MLPWTVTLSSLYLPPTQGALYTHLMTLTSPSLPTDLWPATKGQGATYAELETSRQSLTVISISDTVLSSFV